MIYTIDTVVSECVGSAITAAIVTILIPAPVKIVTPSTATLIVDGPIAAFPPDSFLTPVMIVISYIIILLDVAVRRITARITTNTIMTTKFTINLVNLFPTALNLTV